MAKSLLGDASKARAKLKRSPRTSFAELVQEMVLADLKAAQRDEVCKAMGYDTKAFYE